MYEAYTNQIVRAFKQAPWRKQTQTVAALAIALLVIAVVGGLYLSVASRAGTAGRDLQAWELRKTELTRQNDELRAQLAQLRTVEVLAGRARVLGFVPANPEEIEYLPVPNYPQPHAATATPPQARHASSARVEWL